ncbi:hypothetical protein AB2M95_02430 [Pseudomonas chlororaphis]|uniref:hypothetical protein n=1 Tax=Pseudomonas chlororaphis TaxID=587753 RepID=UPI003461AF38
MPTENKIQRYTFKGAAGEYVYAPIFDRVSAERDALQADLTERDQRVDELEGLLRLARQFVVNGIDLGYIQMPDTDTPDPAHDLVPKIDAVLNPAPNPTCCGSCPAGCIGEKP